MEKEFIKLSQEFWFDFIKFLPRLIIATVVLVFAIYFGKKIASQLKRRLSRKLEDSLLANFIGRITRWIFTLIGIIISMDMLGLANFAGGLIAGAGVTALILGFAFKDIGENFLSGIILAFNRPFKVGDIIETQKITGSIISLDLRATTLKTFEGYDVFIPNSMIVNNPLINYNREGMRRFDFIVGIDYDNDVSKARMLILESLKDVKEILHEPPPFVIVSELTSNSTNLKVFFWVNALEAARNLLLIKSEVIELTVKAFKEGGVNIPYDSMQIQFNKGIPEIPVNLIKNEGKENNKV